MTTEPDAPDLIATCITVGAELDPFEQWVFLSLNGHLRDEPGDRRVVVDLLRAEWGGDDDDPSIAAGRVSARLRAASLATDAAFVPDPGSKTARARLADYRRRREGPGARFQDLLEAEWVKVKAPREHVEWSYRLSPALPAEWPPDGRLVYYAGASGRDLRHPDARHRAPTWARIETVRDESAAPRIVCLADEFREERRPGITIPRWTTEQMTSRDLGKLLWEEFEILLSTPGLPDETEPMTGHLKKYYRILAPESARERHAAFYAWFGR